MKHYIDAARATHKIKPQKFGDWIIRTRLMPHYHKDVYDYKEFTQLIYKIKPKLETLHRIEEDGKVYDVVMDDTTMELQRHLPAYQAAHGHVLKTGLGLGCFVRACLLKDSVKSITVVEVRQDLIDVIAPQLPDDDRIRIICADALEWKPDRHYDFCWHDIWCPRNIGLAALHAQMIKDYQHDCDAQGAWAFPRHAKRIARQHINYIG